MKDGIGWQLNVLNASRAQGLAVQAAMQVDSF
jgi:hypothetical protein